MPQTPIYGLPFENPSDLPGHSVTGGPMGDQPILAEAVEDELARIDAQFIPPTMQVFESSDVWTRPPGLRAVRVRVIGGGGKGGTAGSTDAGESTEGGGGGGGGYAESIISASNLNATETVTVGLGATTPGETGGSSAFGTHLSATGGSPGFGMSASSSAAQRAPGGLGGIGVNGQINTHGSDGEFGVIVNNVNVTKNASGGGTALAGSRRQNTFVSGTGESGRFPGGGGSGASNGFDAPQAQGGDGAGGVVIVEHYY